MDQRSTTIFSPAKINLFLAITGLRPDNYHNILSLVCQLDFGDTLTVSLEHQGDDKLSCTDPNVPIQGNFILEALRHFRQATDFKDPVHIHLEKQIPMGSGLGGGSSNAAKALLALNKLNKNPLSKKELHSITKKLGGDYSIFLTEEPKIVSGYGDEIQKAEEAPILDSIKHSQILIVAPGFSVSTAWAYAQMRANPKHYLDEVIAEEALESFMKIQNLTDASWTNNLQPVVFEKYPALPYLIDGIKNMFSVQGMMSGSGSACFFLIDDPDKLNPIKSWVREALGPNTFCKETCQIS